MLLCIERYTRAGPRKVLWVFSGICWKFLSASWASSELYDRLRMVHNNLQLKRLDWPISEQQNKASPKLKQSPVAALCLGKPRVETKPSALCSLTLVFREEIKRSATEGVHWSSAPRVPSDSRWVLRRSRFSSTDLPSFRVCALGFAALEIECTSYTPLCVHVPNPLQFGSQKPKSASHHSQKLGDPRPVLV